MQGGLDMGENCLDNNLKTYIMEVCLYVLHATNSVTLVNVPRALVPLLDRNLELSI